MKTKSLENLTELLESLETHAESEIAISSFLLEKINKLDLLEFFQQQFEVKKINKIIFEKRNTEKLTIFLDWQFSKKIGLKFFSLVNTTEGNAIFLGLEKMSKNSSNKTDLEELIFHTEDKYFIMRHKVANDKLIFPDKFVLSLLDTNLLEKEEYNIKRLQRYMLTNSTNKTATFLQRVAKLKFDEATKILTSKIFIYTLLEVNIEEFKKILKIISSLFKDKILKEILLVVLRQSIEINNLACISFILNWNEFKNLKNKLFDKDDSNNLLSVLKKVDVSKQVMTEFVLNFLDSDSILAIDSNQYNSECKIILDITKFFYSSLKGKDNFSIIKEFTSTFEFESILILKLLRSVVLSISENSNYEKDYSYLKVVIPLLKIICIDPKSNKYDQHVSFFYEVLSAFYAIDFKKYSNKTLFRDNKEKEEFFKKECNFFLEKIQNEIKPTFELENSDINKSMPTDLIADALFDFDLGDHSVALEKLMNLDTKLFDNEAEKAIHCLTLSSDKKIAAKAYYKKGQLLTIPLSESKMLDFERNNLLGTVLACFIKSYIIGNEKSLEIVNTIFNNFYKPMSSKDYIDDLALIFKSYISNLAAFVNGDYKIIHIDRNLDNNNLFNFFKRTVIDNKQICSEGILYLGYLYSHPKFLWHDTNQAYLHYKDAIALKCEIFVIKSLVNHYNSNAFEDSRFYTYLLETDGRIQKTELNQNSCESPSADNKINEFIKLLESNKPKRPSNDLEDLTVFFETAIDNLTEIKVLLAESSKKQALMVIKEKEIEQKSSYKMGYDKIQWTLIIIEAIIQLLNREPKVTSKSYIGEYLNVILAMIKDDINKNRSLLSLKNILEQLIEEIQPKILKSNNKSFFNLHK